MTGPTGGYDAEAQVPPFAIAGLMEGARNAVERYCQVRPGETVLILAEYTVDPVVVQAFAAAAGFVGADVHTLLIKPFSPGGSDIRNPAELVVEAFKAADVVICCSWWAEVHSEHFFFSKLRTYKTRMLACHQTATAPALMTAGRFPPELFFRIKGKALERLRRAERLRWTNELGTDLTFARPTWEAPSGLLAPGTYGAWPFGGANFYPADCNGVVVANESTVTGVPDQPVRLQVRDNRIVKIEGEGADAEALRRFGKQGYYMRHAYIGLNPKGRLKGAPQFEREKHAGCAYVGIDAVTFDGRIDRSVPGFAHVDFQLDTPTIYVDDEVFVDRRHLLLLDDPEVRAWAAEFGDPDKLLLENVRIW